MDFSYRVMIEFLLFIETMLEIFVNILRFIGFGPKMFNNYPKTLKGKVVVITGANTGIGKVTARELAKLGAKVIMGCRDINKATIAANDIINEVKEADIEVKALDLSSLASVRNFAKEVNQTNDKIDYLINNAGLMDFTGTKCLTEDGFEMMFATNYLGHFLLTLQLMDRLKKSSNARIINVSSSAHIRGEIHFDDINLDKTSSLFQSLLFPYNAYSQSKLANVLFSKELAHKLNNSNIKVYCLHPGLIDTNLWNHLNILFSFGFKCFHRLTHMEPELGAQTTLYCTLEESISRETGHYYKNCQKVDEMLSHTEDGVSARKLWDLSCQLVNLEDIYKL